MSEQAIERRAQAPGASGKKAGGASGRRPKQAAATSAKGRGGAAKAAVTKKPAAPKTAEPKKSAAPKTAEPKKATAPKTAEPKKSATPKTAEPKKSTTPKAAEPKKSTAPKTAESRKANAPQSKGAGKLAKATSRASTAGKDTRKPAGGAKKQAAAGTPSGRKAAKPAARRAKAAKVQANPVAEAANQKNTSERRREKPDDLFLERRAASPSPEAGDGTPPEKGRVLFGALNACLAIAIAVVAALGLRLQGQYADFQRMREVVDQQTFYEGTTVEGVDVSKMTLSNAMDYWRDRVEARNAGRTVTLDDGTAITAGELGYTSDYESVLTTAWSLGRSGTLEERYRMAANRSQNPAAYVIHRTDYSEALVDQFVQMQALKIDRDPQDATVASFNVDTYEFAFNPSQVGRHLDGDALKRDLLAALAAGGGDVTLAVTELQPAITTDLIGEMYGLIDYAITNASSSSRSRLNNIQVAMSLINGAKLAPGETFSFNERVGQRTADRGFKMATAYSGGEVTEQVGGGICQVSTTLFNAAVKADMKIDERHNHSLTVHYVDKGKDATVDWGHQDLKFTNTSPDDIYICCYLTDDKRVRFGIFGRLLPGGEKITLEAVTTEAIKYKTEYLPDPSLPSGQTKVSQNGRDGYKAEAYKVRWDAQGNELSRELLCTSVYKSKDEVILYGT